MPSYYLLVLELLLPQAEYLKDTRIRVSFLYVKNYF